VASGLRGDRCAACRARRGPVGGRGDRPFGPDARRDPARRRGPGASALHPLERRPEHRAMRSADPLLAGPARRHRQPGDARLHRAQADVGARARARVVRANRHGAPAQGLVALAPLRREGRGPVRRVGNALARRRPARMVRRGARGDRHAPRADAAAGRRQRTGGRARARVGAALGLPVRAGAGRRRGRQRRGCGRRRRGPRGRRLRLARHLGRSLGDHRAIRAGTTTRGPCLLPRPSRALAPDGRGSLGCLQPLLVGAHRRAERSRLVLARPLAGSLPISPASARRTTTPACALPSSASTAARIAPP